MQNQAGTDASAKQDDTKPNTNLGKQVEGPDERVMGGESDTLLDKEHDVEENKEQGEKS